MSSIAVFSAATVALAASVLLIVIVLVQEPKSDALPGVLGAAGGEVIGATGARGLRRVVGALATVWIVACLVQAIAG